MRGAERRGNPEELELRGRGKSPPRSDRQRSYTPATPRITGRSVEKKRKIVDFSNPRGNKKGKIYAI